MVDPSHMVDPIPMVVPMSIVDPKLMGENIPITAIPIGYRAAAFDAGP